MHNGIVTNAHVIAHRRRVFFVRAMHRGVILDIHLVAKSDGIDIAADDASKPKTATIAATKLTNYRRIFS
jgi:hypothetical protein